MWLVSEDSGYCTDKFRSDVYMFSVTKMDPRVIVMLINISCTWEKSSEDKSDDKHCVLSHVVMLQVKNTR